MQYKFLNSSGPTLHINSDNVALHKYGHATTWAVFQTESTDGGAGKRYAVVEVYDPKQDVKGIPALEKCTHYRGVVYQNINKQRLIAEVGIKYDEDRETLTALGIDWEAETLITI